MIKALNLPYMFDTGKPLATLQELRVQLLNTLTVYAFILGLLIYVPSALLAVQKGFYSYALNYTVIYGLLTAITIRKYFSWQARSIGWLLMLYMVGAINLYVGGMNIHVGVFFLGLVIFSSLFYDLRGGAAAFVVSFATMLGFGYFEIFKGHIPNLFPVVGDSDVWAIALASFFLLVITLLGSVTSLMRGLQDKLSVAISLTEELHEKNAALRESEERYRTLLEMSPEMVTLLDLNGRVLSVNRSGLDLFGVKTMEEGINRTILDFAPQEEHEVLRLKFTRSIKRGGVFKDLVLRAKKQDGSLFWAEFSGSAMTDSTGAVRSILVVGRDVTGRKNAELSLLKKADQLAFEIREQTIQLDDMKVKFNELLTHTPTVVYAGYISDEGFKGNFISENVRREFGYEVEDFANDPAFMKKHVHPEDYARLVEETRAGMEGSKPITVEYRFMDAFGSYRWLHDTSRIVGSLENGSLELIGSMVDITDKKKMELALKDSEALYRTIVETSPDAIALIDLEGNILMCNEQAARLHRVSGAKDLIGKNAFTVYKLSGQEVARALVSAQKLLIEGSSRGFVYNVTREDGTPYTIEINASVIYDVFGVPQSFVTVSRDITERELLNNALRESEQRFSTIFNTSPVGLAISSLKDGKFVSANRAFLELSGYAGDELTGHDGLELGFWPDPEERKELYSLLSSQGSVRQHQALFRNKKGEIGNYLVSLEVIELDGEKHVLGVLQNISELKRAERQLRELSTFQSIVLDAVDAVIVSVDSDKRVLLANKFASATFGRPLDQMIGKTLHELIPVASEVTQKRILQMDNALSEKSPIHFADTQNGKWYENSIYPVLDSAGEVSRLVIYARDTTVEKEYSEKLKQANVDLEDRVHKRTLELKASRDLLRIQGQKIISALEDERKRISYELHDGAGQVLIGLRLNLGAVYNELPEDPSGQKARIQNALSVTDELVEKLRSVSYSLRPPAFDLMGLNSALSALCREVEHQSKIHIFYQSGALPDLQDEAGISIYRFVHEALANIVKHSHATQASVSADYADEKISVHVSDNGVGFDARTFKKGIGIDSVTDRFNLLGGVFSMDSAPGLGVQLRVELPWKVDAGFFD